MEDKDYKKLYEEAIAKAKKAVADGMVSQNFVEDIFHEHEESENKRIRKQIIYAIKELHVCDETKRKCIAWLKSLEKQSAI